MWLLVLVFELVFVIVCLLIGDAVVNGAGDEGVCCDESERNEECRREERAGDCPRSGQHGCGVVCVVCSSCSCSCSSLRSDLERKAAP